MSNDCHWSVPLLAMLCLLDLTEDVIKTHCKSRELSKISVGMIRACRLKYATFLAGVFVVWILYQVYRFSNSPAVQLPKKHDSGLKKDHSVSSTTLLNSVHNELKMVKCSSIQLVVVCGGYKATKDLIVLVKSILAVRKNRLHLHLIVDKATKAVLGNLFRTWNVRDLVVSFYLFEKFEEDLKWIPNTHYSGVFGLLKLLIPKILPRHITKVIALDTDLIFTDAIGKLWKLFDNFSNDQAIGLVENQSNWYLGTLYPNYIHWPALGRGFNTGVMLLDCAILRSLNWENLWKKVTQQELEVLETTVLADQDIINAVLKRKPTLVHTLPCVWNLQLSDNMKFELCYSAHKAEVKVVHWNFRKNRQKTYKHVELFKGIKQRFMDMNGALLRQSAIICEDNNFDEYAADHSDDMCTKFVLSSSVLHRTHLNYYPFKYETFKNDVTVIVHLSIDRLQMLEFLCRNWDGPVSVSVFLSDAELSKLELFVSSSNVLSKRQNIAYHLVYQNSIEDVYPINLLRNIALQQSVTDFVFLYDVDFIPMPSLYSYILSHLSEVIHNNLTAFVVPAFESLWYKNGIPVTKADLMEQMQTGAVTTFRENVWPQGHAATNFSRWFTAEKPYIISWEKDFEPYVVLSKRNCPLYDKRFIGFGWNKISHIMELDAMGFQFVVLPHGFITHIPHLPSMELVKYRTLSKYRECMNDLKINFIENLINKYSIHPQKYKSFMEEY